MLLAAGSAMGLQTNGINGLSVMLAASAAVAGSKIAEYCIMTRLNEDETRRRLALDLTSRRHLDNLLRDHRHQVEELQGIVATLEAAKDKRVETEVKGEKDRLRALAEGAVARQLDLVAERMRVFQRNLLERLAHSEHMLLDLAVKLEHYRVQQGKQQRLERLCRMIVAEDAEAAGRDYCSMESIHKELRELLPLARQYSLLDSGAFSILRYCASSCMSKMLFLKAPLRPADLLHEIDVAVEKGDLIYSLFLFNKLHGWPRLILRDWSEKCRQRLVYIHEVQHSLYMNKD